jgi:hypothetical protein
MIKSILKHLSVQDSAFAAIYQTSLLGFAHAVQEDHSGDLSTPTRDNTNLNKQELEYYL